jgi:hypothetical protein
MGSNSYKNGKTRMDSSKKGRPRMDSRFLFAVFLTVLSALTASGGGGVHMPRITGSFMSIYKNFRCTLRLVLTLPMPFLPIYRTAHGR